MKAYTRTPLALPKATLAGKKGVVLRPGDRLTLTAELPAPDGPVRRRLRVVGETDIFWRWRCEPGMPLLYRSIHDALDASTAYAERYSLHLQGNFEPWRRNAFIMLSRDEVPRETALTFAVMARTDALELAAEGEVCAELGIYLPKPGRHPLDVTELPDQVVRLRLAAGTYDWRPLSRELRIPQEATALLVRLGGTGFAGHAWLGSPRLYAEGGDTLIPPLMPDHPHPSWRHLNWLGENLSRLEQPEFAVRCDGMECFRGPVFNSISRASDFEVPLPLLAAGTHALELELLGPYATALPFVLQDAELLQESARPVEIIAYPDYVPENQPFCVLVERNSGGESRLEVVRVDDAGAARANPAIDLNVGGAAVSIQLRRVVQYSGHDIILSTGDAIYIPQETDEFLRYLAWYMSHQVGNGLCIRPAYRWGGGRRVNPALWKTLVPLLEQLGVRYHLMVDGRELPGNNVNPSDADLAGPNYLGRQEHERDGAFSYWGHMRDDALFVYIFNRGGSEMVHVGLAAPPAPQNGVMVGCFDQARAQDMKEAADLFSENVRLAKRTCTRHTGPSTLFHYFYQAGYDWLGAEQMYGPEEVILSSLRGASRAYDKRDFGAHLAVQWSSAPHDTPEHARRYFLSLATCYLHGVSGINTEEGLWRMDADYAPFDRFSHNCEIHREAHTAFRRFVQTHPRRGTLRVPLAVLQGRYCGWRCFVRGNVWGSTRDDFRFGPAEESFDLLKVFYPRSVLDAVYRFPCDDTLPQGWYSGTPFGLVDLAPLVSPSSSPHLHDYRALAFLGWNTFAEEDFARLCAYVEGGGHLLLAKPHLSRNTRRLQASALPTESPAVGRLLGEHVQAASKTTWHLGKGRVTYFPQDAYPAEAAIRQDYETALRALGDEAVTGEFRRGWIRGSDDVNFAAYDWDESRMRTLYILNIDHWSNRPAAPAQFMFGGRSYDLDVRRGSIEVITASTSVAVMPEGPDVDVLAIEEHEHRLRVRVQSDAGAAVRLFAPKYPQCPQTLRVAAGGIQEMEVNL